MRQRRRHSPGGLQTEWVAPRNVRTPALHTVHTVHTHTHSTHTLHTHTLHTHIHTQHTHTTHTPHTHTHTHTHRVHTHYTHNILVESQFLRIPAGSWEKYPL